MVHINAALTSFGRNRGASLKNRSRPHGLACRQFACPNFLKKYDIPYGTTRQDRRDSAKDMVGAYVADRERERVYSAGIAAFHGAETARETAARKVFRKDFIKTIATDLSSVPVSGVVVKEGDSVADKTAEAVSRGVAKANTALDDPAGGVPVNLYLTPKDRENLSSYFTNATGYVDIPDSAIGDILFRTNSSENPGTLLVHANPITSFCARESAEEKCAKIHAGLVPDDTPTPPSPGGTNGSGDEITADDIPTYIGKLVRHMPSQAQAQCRWLTGGIVPAAD
jgi:hypothetical protein